jgi:hypothetical protein
VESIIITCFYLFSLKNKVEVQDYFRFELPKNGFEPRYKREDVIHLVGLSTCLTKIPESDSLFYSIYRLFENGEIKVQYIILEKDSNKDKLQLKTRPNYSLHDDRFENLYRAIEVSELPTTLYKSKERTLAHIKKGPYRQYLEHIEEFNEATGPFSSSKKMDVAEHLVATNTPIT